MPTYLARIPYQEGDPASGRHNQEVGIARVMPVGITPIAAQAAAGGGLSARCLMRGQGREREPPEPVGVVRLEVLAAATRMGL